HDLCRRPRIRQPDGDGFRRRDRGRIRYHHQHEPAGRDRELRPAGRRGARAGGAMSEGIRQADRAAPDAGAQKGATRDLFSKFDEVIQTRETLLASGVEDPFSLVMEKVLSPTRAICNGRDTILLGTYNYMGMTFDPDVIEAGKEALDNFGSGTTGSRVLNGTYQGHKECEAALREFYAMDHAMLFSTGYQANLGIISTIAGKGDYIVLDID